MIPQHDRTCRTGPLHFWHWQLTQGGRHRGKGEVRVTGPTSVVLRPRRNIGKLPHVECYRCLLLEVPLLRLRFPLHQDLLRACESIPQLGRVSGSRAGFARLDKQVPGLTLLNEQTAESQSPNSDGTLPCPALLLLLRYRVSVLRTYLSLLMRTDSD